MNVTLRQLRALVLVGRLGSFTRAADDMHLTQSAVSLLVRELETSMKTKLIDRTTRSVGLTDAGREFYPEAQRILADLERAMRNVDQLMARAKGRIVIAAPFVLASTYLPGLVAGFRAKYPAIELVLKDTLPSLVLPLLRSGTADVGIGTFSEGECDLHRTLLFTEAMVAVFPAGHALSGRREVCWSDIAGLPIITLRRGSVFRELAETGFVAAGMVLQPSLEVEYAGTVIGLVSAGLGVAVLPGYAMHLTDSTRIAWRRMSGPVVVRDVSLIQRVGPTPSYAAQAFVEFVKGSAVPAKRRAKRR